MSNNPKVSIELNAKDNTSAGIRSATASMQKFGTAIRDSVGKLPGTFKTSMASATQSTNALKTSLGSIAGSVRSTQSTIKSTMQGISSSVKASAQAVNASGATMRNAFNALPDGMRNAKAAVAGYARTIPTIVLSSIRPLPALLRTLMVGTSSALSSGFKNAGPQIRNNMRSLGNTASAGASNMVRSTKSGFSGLRSVFGNVAGAIASFAATVKDKFVSLGQKIKASFVKWATTFRIGISVTGVASVLGAIAVYGKLGDAYTNLQNRLRLVTTDSKNLQAVQSALFDIANRTMQPVDDTVQAYSRMAANASALGLSQQQLLTMTEAVNNSMRISGADAGQASAAMVQFAQALGSGVLRGDELNSVMENSPRLAKAVADGMGITVGALRKLGQEGKLEAGKVAQAVLSQAGVINTEAKKMGTTFSGAITVLKNNALQAIGSFDQVAGGTSFMASVTLDAADAVKNLGIWFVDNQEKLKVWKDIAVAGVKIVVGGFVTGMGVIIGAVTTAVSLIKNAFMGIVDVVKNAMDGNWQGVKDSLKKRGEDFGNTFKNAWGGVVKGQSIVSNGVVELQGAASRLPGAQEIDRIETARGTRRSGTVGTTGGGGGGVGGGGGDGKKEKEQDWKDLVPGAKEMMADAQGFSAQLRQAAFTGGTVDGAADKVQLLRNRLKDFSKTLNIGKLGTEKFSQAIDEMSGSSDTLQSDLQALAAKGFEDTEKKVKALESAIQSAQLRAEAGGTAVVLPADFDKDIDTSRNALLAMLAQLEAAPQTDDTVAKIEKVRDAIGRLNAASSASKDVARAAQQKPVEDAQRALEVQKGADALRPLFDQSLNPQDLRAALQRNIQLIQDEMKLIQGAAASGNDPQAADRFVQLSGALSGYQQDLEAAKMTTGTFSESFTANVNQSIGATKSWGATFGSITSQALQTFVSTAAQSFAAVMQGQMSLGEAIKNIAAETLSVTMNALGSEFVVRAVGAYAKGIEGDPRGFAAGNKFMIAATMAFALGGMAKGMGGSSGGGGGGKEAQERAALAKEGDKGSGTIIFEGDFLDLNNPRTRSQLEKMVRDMRGMRISFVGSKPI